MYAVQICLAFTRIVLTFVGTAELYIQNKMMQIVFMSKYIDITVVVMFKVRKMHYRTIEKYNCVCVWGPQSRPQVNSDQHKEGKGWVMGSYRSVSS